MTVDTPPNGADEMTELLRAWGGGDAEASEAVARLVYEELRRQARRFLRREGEGHTLQPTALVHEAWLRIDDQHDANWESRTQFFGVAAQMMRRVLVDHARARRAQKRGDNAIRVTLDVIDRELAAPGGPAGAVDLLALDEALARLASLDPQKA